MLPRLAGTTRFAWFLDFDGTLVEIAERPDAVRLERRTLKAIEQLFAGTGGAVAIVTGREIATIDRFMAPLRLPAAGVHGLERRDHAGNTFARPVDAGFLAAAETLFAPLVAREPDLLLERKAHSIALHYRACPAAEADCLALMEELATRGPNVRLQRGKMVIEARPDGGDKGTAIAEFMAEAPFRGRLPVFAGDDVTDEDAFSVVNAMDGITIRVGDGDTTARFRADSTTGFLAWLAAAAGLRGEGEDIA